MEAAETLLSLCVAVGLSAACGFRVFVPLLIASLAAHAGHLKLASGFEWLGSDAAVVALGVATVLEIAAYYIPWLDNALDSVATPAAVVAGTLLTASVATDLSPLLKWSLAVIAGGGSAALVQTGTVLVRAASTVTTGGLANPLLATAELGGSVGLTLLALVAPVAAVVMLAGVVGVGGWAIHRRRARSTPPALPARA
jgi:hypothetical protein